MSHKIQDVHISQIRPGDIILHRDGKFRTVCKKDIHEDRFMGRSIFGDCYWSGHLLVKRVYDIKGDIDLEVPSEKPIFKYIL